MTGILKVNTIQSPSTNDDITLDPNGTGDVVVASGHNLGIGSTSPTAALSVHDSVNQSAIVRIKNDSSDGCHNALTIESSTSADKNIGIRFANQSAEKGGIGYVQNDKVAFYNGTSTGNGITIDSSGNCGIGTTPSGARLDINTSANEIGTDILCESTSQTSDVFRISASRNTTDNTYFLMRASCNGVADRFQIRDSGNVKNVNNSYGAISDERMKENIVDANSQWDDIKALQLRNYNMIGEDVTQLGVIAQELEAAGMNGLVEEGDFFHATANPDGETRKSVKYSVLYIKAIGALQEAIAKIETLEAKVAALEAGE